MATAIYYAFGFQDEAVVEQFALKFKEVDLAQQFETHLRCLDSFSDWQLLVPFSLFP